MGLTKRERLICYVIGLASPVAFFAFIRLLPNGLTASDSGVLVRQIAIIAISILWLIWLVRRSPLSANDLGLRRIRWGDPAWGLVAAFANITVGVLTAMALARWGFEVQNKAVIGSLSSRPTGLIVMLVIGAAISEEAIFRATMISAIRAASGSVVLAVFVSTAVFALFHISYGLAKLPIAFFSSAVFAILFVRCRSLPACIFAHAMIDFIGLAGVLMHTNT